MNSIWDKSARGNLEHRIDSLNADARPKWGKFSAPQMVTHLNEALRMALGELPVKPRKTPFKKFPLKQLIIYVVPFPKGAPTAPELLAGDSRELSAEVARFKELLNRFATSSHVRMPEHPAFGQLSRNAWGRLGYRHIDHHLKQFGV